MTSNNSTEKRTPLIPKWFINTFIGVLLLASFIAGSIMLGDLITKHGAPFGVIFENGIIVNGLVLVGAVIVWMILVTIAYYDKSNEEISEIFMGVSMCIIILLISVVYTAFYMMNVPEGEQNIPALVGVALSAIPIITAFVWALKNYDELDFSDIF